VKVFRLFKLEQTFFFGVQSVGRCTTSYLLAGPVCLWRLVFCRVGLGGRDFVFFWVGVGGRDFVFFWVGVGGRDFILCGLFSMHRHQVPNGFPKAFPIAPKFLPVYMYIFIRFNFGEGTFYYKNDWQAQLGMWPKMNFVLLDPVGKRIRINDKHPFS
jgi:hypothetical protein